MWADAPWPAGPRLAVLQLRLGEKGANNLGGVAEVWSHDPMGSRLAASKALSRQLFVKGVATLELPFSLEREGARVELPKLWGTDCQAYVHLVDRV